MRSKCLLLSVAVLWTAAIMAQNNVITYRATAKLKQVNGEFESGLHTKAFNATIQSHDYDNGVGTITFSENVTSIQKSAFYHCTSILSVSLPSSVTSIASNSFSQVNNVEYTGSASGKPWGAKSVNGYVDAPFVYANNTRKKLLGYASTATQLTIPESVTSIGNYAFYQCTNLTQIALPSALVSIGSSAFYECSSLTSIVIPESVKSMDTWAFAWCKKLTQITLPSGLTAIADNMLYQTALTSIDLPSGVKSIGQNAFGRCMELQSVAFPAGLTTIGYSAFSQNYKLSSVSLGNALTTLADYAFLDCTALKSLSMPASMKSVGKCAFQNCSALTSITCLALTPPTCGDTPFNGVSSTIPILIPNGTAHRYRKAGGWNYFTSYPINILSDTTDNTAMLAAWKNESMDVVIQRPFYCDGGWNTICLPFSLSPAQYAASALSEWRVMTLEGAHIINPGQDNETLLLSLGEVSEIQAGKAYLIDRKDSVHPVVDSMLFENVTMQVSVPVGTTVDDVTLCGTFSPLWVEAHDKGILFVGKNGKLNWPNANGSIRGFRGYFTIPIGSASPFTHGMNACIGTARSTPNSDHSVSVSLLPAQTSSTLKLLEQGRVVILCNGHRYDLSGNPIY